MNPEHAVDDNTLRVERILPAHGVPRSEHLEGVPRGGRDAVIGRTHSYASGSRGDSRATGADVRRVDPVRPIAGWLGRSSTEPLRFVRIHDLHVVRTPEALHEGRELRRAAEEDGSCGDEVPRLDHGSGGALLERSDPEVEIAKLLFQFTHGRLHFLTEAYKRHRDQVGESHRGALVFLTERAGTA